MKVSSLSHDPFPVRCKNSSQELRREPGCNHRPSVSLEEREKGFSYPAPPPNPHPKWHPIWRMLLSTTLQRVLSSSPNCDCDRIWVITNQMITNHMF